MHIRFGVFALFIYGFTFNVYIYIVIIKYSFEKENKFCFCPQTIFTVIYRSTHGTSRLV